jgi:hypothetical protein
MGNSLPSFSYFYKKDGIFHEYPYRPDMQSVFDTCAWVDTLGARHRRVSRPMPEWSLFQKRLPISYREMLKIANLYPLWEDPFTPHKET